MIAAASDVIWNNREACGRMYTVRCTGGTNQVVPQPCKRRNVTVKIVDYCPEGCEGTIHLSLEAFAMITDPDAGKINIEYLHFTPSLK
ncbi:Eg45-like domain containing protein [Thalictrum thalictroides]|uniref:Eg45-like domain containing protein n=1 Tax=Thalictrum thalictroides TaxID=46969 RepID=A0A7J6VQ50_THATH|nr:Eg45-like domain containing protein [Thalictrum thalictroides]